MQASMVSPPLVNNMYHNQVQHSHVVIPSIIQHPGGYVIPPNMVCYASPPIQPTYSQPILIPSNAVHTFTPTAHYYSVVTTQQMATSVTHTDPTEMQHNGSMQLSVGVPENEVVDETENPEDDPNATTPILNDNDVEPTTYTHEQPPLDPQSPAVVQNGFKTATSPSVGKSWASLFNHSNNTSQQNGFSNNADVNVEKTKPVVENKVADIVCPIKHPKKSSQFIDPDCYRMGGELFHLYS